jgi:putative peptidoglycan lipid II flippase
MSLARDITTVGGGTLASRLLAYVRDAWIAALLGAGPYSETLFAVLQVVNFFRRLLSEGALNSAFVPIWTKLHGSTDGAANANRFSWRVLLMMFCVAGSIALLAVFLGRYVIAGAGSTTAAIVFAFLLFAAPLYPACGTRRVTAAAQREGRVGAVAFTTVFNLTMLFVLLLPRTDRALSSHL